MGNLAKSSQNPNVGEVGGMERELTLVPGTDIECGITNDCVPASGVCCLIRRKPEV